MKKALILLLAGALFCIPRTVLAAHWKLFGIKLDSSPATMEHAAQPGYVWFYDKSTVRSKDDHVLVWCEAAFTDSIKKLEEKIINCPACARKFAPGIVGELKLGTIGVQLTTGDNLLTVYRVLKGGPADKAGIQVGDQIVQIDGQPLKGMSGIEACKRTTGPIGSKITLTILRKGVQKPLKFKVVRDMMSPLEIDPAIMERLADNNDFPLSLKALFEFDYANGQYRFLQEQSYYDDGTLDKSYTQTTAWTYVDPGNVALTKLYGILRPHNLW